MGERRRRSRSVVCGGTLAGTAGNEQDVTGLQRHVRSFPRQNLLKVYRNLNGAIFAFPDDLGLVQASGRVCPFRHRQYLQYRGGAGIPHSHTHGTVYVAHDVNDDLFGDHHWRLRNWDTRFALLVSWLRDMIGGNQTDQKKEATQQHISLTCDYILQHRGSSLATAENDVITPITFHEYHGDVKTVAGQRHPD